MVRQLRCVVGSIGLMVCFAANPLQAGLVTYIVDLSGMAGSGVTLKVFGTIMVDPAQPISAATTFSDLRVQRQAELPILLSSPTYSSFAPTPAMAWSSSGGNLYIDRLVPSAAITWVGFFASVGSVELNLASGLIDHRIIYRPVNGDPSDVVILKPASGPDGPNGFLVGTAIPEPSSLLLVAGIGSALSIRRRRG